MLGGYVLRLNEDYDDDGYDDDDDDDDDGDGDDDDVVLHSARVTLRAIVSCSVDTFYLSR